MTVEFYHPYKVDLELFEGPLDLLLHLIRKNDVDILDIPISPILDQYMEYIGLMEEMNIDLAGDFLLMASELAHIKSKLLLPPDQVTQEEQEQEDPRAELIRRLLEYQRYKEAAEALWARPMLGRDVFHQARPYEEAETEEGPVEVELFALLSCFYDLLKKAPKKNVHSVMTERVSVTDRIYEIMALMQGKEMSEFSTLFSDQPTREGLIVTLLAILEMARLKMLKITQSQARGEIYLCPSFAELGVEVLAGQVTLQ